MIVIAKGDTQEAQARKSEKLALAKDALEQGEAFADVARRYSEDPLAVDGGLRDWIEPDNLRQELRAPLMDSALGTISDVIEMGSHYSIVIVHDRQLAEQKAFEDVYAQIEQMLRHDKSQQLYAEWIARLRQDSFVKVLNKNPF